MSGSGGLFLNLWSAAVVFNVFPRYSDIECIKRHWHMAQNQIVEKWGCGLGIFFAYFTL
jgi:hypothetical protein